MGAETIIAIGAGFWFVWAAVVTAIGVVDWWRRRK